MLPLAQAGLTRPAVASRGLSELLGHTERCWRVSLAGAHTDWRLPPPALRMCECERLGLWPPLSDERARTAARTWFPGEPAARTCIVFRLARVHGANREALTTFPV